MEIEAGFVQKANEEARSAIFAKRATPPVSSGDFFAETQTERSAPQEPTFAGMRRKASSQQVEAWSRARTAGGLPSILRMKMSENVGHPMQMVRAHCAVFHDLSLIHI